MTKWNKPFWTLILITPFLTELLSTNFPPHVFFQPLLFLLLITVGYGFPILLLREFAVRKKIGWRGLILVGMSYGLYNEGWLAKTVLLSEKIPIDSFDHYGITGGFAIPWGLTICLWHTCHAVLYPISIVMHLFPESSEKNWVNKSEILWTTLFTLPFPFLAFFRTGENGIKGTPSQGLILFIIMLLLLILSTRLTSNFKSQEISESRGKFMLCGVLYLILSILIPILLAKVRVPLPFFYTYFIILLYFTLLFLTKYKIKIIQVLCFGMGDYLLSSILGLIAVIPRGSLEQIISCSLFILFFSTAIFYLLSQKEKKISTDIGSSIN